MASSVTMVETQERGPSGVALTPALYVDLLTCREGEQSL
jgi:hypothetical protein